MDLPIIISEHGDLTIYHSTEQAENALEVVDVKNEEYVAFDAKGRSLVLTVAIEEKSGPFGLFPKSVERVRLAADPASEIDEARVRFLLTQFLNRADISIPSEKDETLSCFINKVVEKIGYSN